MTNCDGLCLIYVKIMLTRILIYDLVEKTWVQTKDLRFLCWE